MTTSVNPRIISLGAQGAELHPDHIIGFVHVYQEAFREEPWNEHHPAIDVHRKVLARHLPHCALIAAVDDQVVGLAGAYPVLDDLDGSNVARDFLVANQRLIPFDLDRTIYMSELAVLPEFRRRGIGLALTNARLDWARENGFKSFLMRTAEEGSLSKELYDKRIPGAFQIGGLIQDVSLETVKSASARRIYIGGHL